MSRAGLVDSHIHLTDYEPGADICGIVRRARAAGVTHLVCNGTSERDWDQVLELGRTIEGVVPCVGLHPWFVKDRSPGWLGRLERLIADNDCGIGEAGLDKCVEDLDRGAQEEAFRAQLELARKYAKPMTVHCVRSWGWLMDVLRSEPGLPERMLLHAYGGSVDMVKPLANLGAYFSFSGKVLDGNFARARAAILAVPADRLLVETDAPNMLPPPSHITDTVTTTTGKDHNHPANLPAIVAGIAELLGEPIDALRERLWENAKRFHGLAPD